MWLKTFDSTFEFSQDRSSDAMIFDFTLTLAGDTLTITIPFAKLPHAKTKKDYERLLPYNVDRQDLVFSF